MTARLKLIKGDPAPRNDDGPDPAAILLMMESRARLAGVIAALDGEIAEACRAWSYERGYRVPLRPEAARREIEAETLPLRRNPPPPALPAARVVSSRAAAGTSKDMAR